MVTGDELVLVEELVEGSLYVTVFVLREVHDEAHPATVDQGSSVRGLASPRLTGTGGDGCCFTHVRNFTCKRPCRLAF